MKEVEAFFGREIGWLTEPRGTATIFPMRNLCSFILLLVCSVRGHGQNANASTFHINPQRLQGTLEKLSEFGRNPEGGITRLGFSETDLAAREYVTGLMKQAGLDVRIDAAGNIFGLRGGSEKLPKLLFGSHIDSVLHGGNFDGDVGSMGAIEIMRALNDAQVKTRHPFEAVIWTNEEGNHFGIGTLGSGVASGSLGPEILETKDEQGSTLADWLRRYGQNPAHLADARIPPGVLAAYLELHIEQGPNLDETKVPIGVVQGIVGIKRWNCVVIGVANHAGTTPMNRRKDALPPLPRTYLPFDKWYKPKKAHKWVTWDTSGLRPERSMSYPDMPNSQLSCATSTLQRLIACGNGFSRDSRRQTSQKISRLGAACSIARNPLVQTQVCRLLSVNQRSRLASLQQTCLASPGTTRKRSPGSRPWR
jgi:hypothetical protein